ncbi:MAG: hypothetical protein JO224_04655 [Pelomonas sp.]|nr:hypothetical protein [Roseateles sp.]
MTRRADWRDLARAARLALGRTIAVGAMAALPAGPAWAGPGQAVAPAPTRVVYPSAPQVGDHRGDFYIELLRLALAKSDGRFQVVGSTDPSMASRAFVRLARHEGVDVIWAPTTREFEHDYRAVRVPLDKGLLGWRLLLVRRDDLARFAKVATGAQLRALRAGLAAEWSDTQVLRDNGLPVVTASLYDNLFPMLAAQRFDYFPRGVAEIVDEQRAHPEFAIEPRLVLHYPACTYFFVARDNERLAAQIELGLRRALQDGAFEKLFDFYNGDAVRAAGLEQRRVLELRNTVEPPGCAAPPLVRKARR